MSKKKNKKQRRAPFDTKAVSIENNANKDLTSLTEKEITEETQATEAKDPIEELSEHYAYVKKDTKKLLVMLGVLALLIVGTYFVNKNTTILTNFGDWIYKVSNIQI
jgi:hypothetical protein